MAFTNQSKPVTSLANTAKVNIGETWATITTIWATETRTWAQLTSLITNQSIVGSEMLWSAFIFPWTLDLPWQLTGGITNQSKPV